MEQEAAPGGAGYKRCRCGAEERGRSLAQLDGTAWKMEEEERQAMYGRSAEDDDWRGGAQEMAETPRW